MSVLVVGATGTVGSEVTRQLRAAGVPVRAGSRTGGVGRPTVRLDLSDPSSWPGALAGADRMFLLRPPDLTRVSGIAPFLTAARSAGIWRAAVLSVQGAGRNPLLPHRRLEQLVERSGLAWTHLRPAYFLQNLLTVHRAEIRDRGELFVPGGSGRTALVDARHVAAVAVRALTAAGHEGRTYELTGPDAPTWAHVATVLSAVLGRPVEYPRPGAVRYARTELRRGRPAPLVAVTTGLYTATRLGLAARLTDDVPRLLGRPGIALRAFAEEFADAWRP